jgi:hypothetical protein
MSNLRRADRVSVCLFFEPSVRAGQPMLVLLSTASLRSPLVAN